MPSCILSSRRASLQPTPLPWLATTALLAALGAAFPMASGAWTFGNADSVTNRHSFSNNNRYVVFESDATNLVAGDTNGVTDIFRLDTQTGAVVRVSLDSSGNQATGGNSQGPSISGDGNLVVFYSNATNLVAGDTNGQTDVFLRDIGAGATTRLSVDSSGVQATGGSSLQPMISADGSKVVFRSAATNLVASDTNSAIDIFVRDIAGATTTRVSVSTAGAQCNGACATPAINQDGSIVAFESDATNLVASDTNGARDEFVRYLSAGITDRVSIGPSAAQSNGGTFGVGMSLDGTRVAFQSDATNLVAADTNAFRDVFVFDLATSTTIRVSVDSSGVQGNASSFAPALSGDGTKVAFYSDATNLVASDTNGQADIFVRDLSASSTTRASVDSAGAQSTGGISVLASFSADGTKVAFTSTATNLVAGDANGFADVFTRDLSASSTSVPVRLSAISAE